MRIQDNAERVKLNTTGRKNLCCESKDRLNSGNTFYHSVQNFFIGFCSL